MLKEKNECNLKETILNEDGNVLLFAILILLFLVFMTSIISGAVINRATIAREIADSNKATANLEQGNIGVESAIEEMNYQNDELARYYVSMNYYTKGTNSFNGVGGNASLDSYLNGLISNTFQREVKQAMQGPTPNVEKCASVIFTYLTLRRGSVNDLPINVAGSTINVSLRSFMDVNISGYAGYSLDSIAIIPKTADFSYANISSLIDQNKTVLDISYIGIFNTNSGNVEFEKTYVSGEIKPIAYMRNPDGTIKKPESLALKSIYKITRYQNEIIRK